MSSQEKSVVLLSGGMDSAVAAYLLKQQEVELSALTFTADFYKTSKIETHCARKIASILGIRHTVIDFSCLSAIIDTDYFSKTMSLQVLKSAQNNAFLRIVPLIERLKF